MAEILINGNRLDPETQRPALRAFGLASADASKPDYILVQSIEPLSNEQEDELEKLGVKIPEYVSRNTYLCGFKGTDLQRIRNLPYLSWVNVYLDLFVVQSNLKIPAGVMEVFPTVPKDRTTQTVDVLLHKDVEASSPQVLSAVAAAGHADPETLGAGPKKIRLNVESQYLDALAAIDQVHKSRGAFRCQGFSCPGKGRSGRQWLFESAGRLSELAERRGKRRLRRA